MTVTSAKATEITGQEPKALVLSDGTRLSLEDDAGPAGIVEWVLIGDEKSPTTALTMADALEIAGDEYADYVRVRTRSEAAWLRIVSEWFADQADHLEGDLAHSA